MNCNCKQVQTVAPTTRNKSTEQDRKLDRAGRHRRIAQTSGCRKTQFTLSQQQYERCDHKCLDYKEAKNTDTVTAL